MVVGILLAAGAGQRFGGGKLLAEMANGQCIAEVACRALIPAVDRLIAVVRRGDEALAARLAACGAEICVAVDAQRGMGASLAAGVAQAPDGDGWLIALGDMPLVASTDSTRVADALRGGALIVVPVADGRRGHPVGFAPRFLPDLLALSGDAGARALLSKYSAEVVEIPVGDARRWCDVDTSDDLAVARALFKQS
ncbi:MAG: nucleotidyltransferase family protein [Rhodoferax sp.]|mgnify:CR=1 FL=1